MKGAGLRGAPSGQAGKGWGIRQGAGHGAVPSFACCLIEGKRPSESLVSQGSARSRVPCPLGLRPITGPHLCLQSHSKMMKCVSVLDETPLYASLRPSDSGNCRKRSPLRASRFGLWPWWPQGFWAAGLEGRRGARGGGEAWSLGRA